VAAQGGRIVPVEKRAQGREILIPMAAGERATVEVIGYKTSCRTEAAQ